MASRFRTTLVAGAVDSTEVDLVGGRVPEGVDLLSIPELGRRINPWQDLVAFVKLYRLLRATRPHIVHTHTAKAGTLGRVAAVLAKVPVRVHTFHGHVMRGYFSPLTTRLVIAVERLLARFTTCLVTVSAGQAAELTDELRICPPEKMRVVPLGFDLSRFDEQALSRQRGGFRDELSAGERPVLTAVGRLVPIKNHALLLDALAELKRAGTDAILAIVGGGPEEQSLRERTRVLGVEENVRFLGWRNDLDRIYADSDVVVLTSNNEGTPVCLIEALAAGCPVVATDVGGVRDVLEGGRLGAIVPSGDAGGIAAAIDRILGDTERRTELSNEGRRSARARFGVARLLEDMTALYDELLIQRLRGRDITSTAQATSCTT